MNDSFTFLGRMRFVLNAGIITVLSQAGIVTGAIYQGSGVLIVLWIDPFFSIPVLEIPVDRWRIMLQPSTPPGAVGSRYRTQGYGVGDPFAQAVPFSGCGFLDITGNLTDLPDGTVFNLTVEAFNG